MRLSNRRKVPVYNFIQTLLWLFLFGGILAYIIEENEINRLGEENLLLIFVPLLFLVLFYLKGQPIFEYDSDGEALNFKNRNILPFLCKARNDEFPKYKLINYNLISLFLKKKLYITIKSKKNNTITLNYNISYLTKKEINDLKFSLNKIIKTNEERNINLK